MCDLTPPANRLFPPRCRERAGGRGSEGEADPEAQSPAGGQR